jgi:hypothetical protein
VISGRLVGATGTGVDMLAAANAVAGVGVEA